MKSENLIEYHQQSLLSKSPRRLLLFQIKPRRIRTYSSLKRLLDICLAFISLVTLSPGLLIIAALIKVDSRGPVFHKRNRIGLNGKEFCVRNFRTEVQRNQVFGMQYEVTKLGQFLRATAIDQLPALLNILTGDLSFVGRSTIVEQASKTIEVAPKVKEKLLSIKPGLVSLWSVTYDRLHDNTESALALDLVYADKASVAFDLILVFKAYATTLGITATL
ncbi:MAG: sugar transferase [candidate division WOR-3 bacterium]|nr:sugar transferase [candidate division WOR-3 bacterium]